MKLHPLVIAVRRGNLEMPPSRISSTSMIIYGSKGGSDPEPPRAPVEAPDSLASIAYANLLDLTSEGEIEGLVDGARSIFLSETPVMNADGSINYPGIVIQARHGTQDQSYIQGFPSVENEEAVGFALKYDLPWVKAINNNQLSAVRVRLSTPRMTEQNATTGDTTGSYVGYTIQLKTGDGIWVSVVNSAFNGKTTSLYERSHRIDLPVSSIGWTLRVIRLTQDSTSGLISNLTNVVSYTEIIDAKFRYPNSAIYGLKFDASQFNQTPTRAYHLKGLRVKVPVNYDPVLRSYSGVWNGTFKVAYTNNPAWVYYDLLLNDRYGLGHLIKAFQVDRYELYRIAQYCDQPVSNGQGGTEPRFTCNLYLQQRADALKVLQDLAAIFRGMSYWGASQVFVTSDMPEDPTYTYTNANVIDGIFEYVGTGRKTRYSVCLVSWNDPEDFYRAKVEYIEDRDQMALFGHRQTEVTAFGCTSQSQAQRLGRWTLLTNKLETDTVNFSVGLDGVLVRPGKIVRVADNHRAGRRIGGRIRSATINSLILDSEVEVYTGDTITVIMPDGTAVSRVVKDVGFPVTWDSTTIDFSQTDVTWDAESGSQEIQLVTVVTNFPAIPVTQSIWAVDSTTLATQQFRVLSVIEDFTGDTMMFKVTATKHVIGKFAAVDTGTRIESPPITVIPPSVQPPPSNITLSSDWATSQGVVNTTMNINWTPAPGAVAYEVQWKFNNGNWIYAGRTGTAGMAVVGILAGRYIARVQAFNANGLGSVWANSIEYTLEGKTTPPPVVSFLHTDEIVFGIKVSWGFPAGANADTTQRTEIWYSLSNDINTAIKQGDYAYPQNSMALMGLGSNAEFYFWARLVDRIGNVGAFYGPVYGQAEQDASVILDYLTGLIQDTQLAQSLLERIDSDGGANVRIDTIINELAAMYTIKTQLTVDGRTYLAGIGVGVENNQGIIESQVLIAASRFAVLDPNTGGSSRSPFVIQGGVVYIDSAFIQNATISTAKIVDAAITRAKIGNAAIGSAQIEDLSVVNAKIGDLSVDTLKIAGRAVTIPLSAYTQADLTLPATGSLTWYTIQQVSWTASGWETTINCTCQYGSQRADSRWRLLINGGVYAEGSVGNNTINAADFRASLAVTFQVALGGAITAAFQMAPPVNADGTNFRLVVSNRSMTTLETKR